MTNLLNNSDILADRIIDLDGLDNEIREENEEIQSNDVYFLRAGDDLFRGEFGSDTVFGGMGNDRMIGTISENSQPQYYKGGRGDDRLLGSASNDLLKGNQDNDYLSGGDGNDTLWGNSGRDELFGGDGDDLLYGGANSDKLNGGNGNDTLYGGKGQDTLGTTSGNNVLYGGRGNDTMRISTSGSGTDTLTGGHGNDTFEFNIDIRDANLDVNNPNVGIIKDFNLTEDSFKITYDRRFKVLNRLRINVVGSNTELSISPQNTPRKFFTFAVIENFTDFNLDEIEIETF